MRRGYKNRWGYDQSPQADPLVTVTTNGKVRGFSLDDVGKVGKIDAEAKLFNRLRKAGYV